MTKIMFATLFTLFGAVFSMSAASAQKLCPVSAEIPEAVTSPSGNMKVIPTSHTDMCTHEDEGVEYVSFFHQAPIDFESTIRDNIVLRYSMAEDKPKCLAALKDGPYMKGSVIVDKGLNKDKHFITTVRDDKIPFLPKGVVCIHIENP